MSFNSIKYVDLHTHTKASDGSLSPAELVALAQEKGLSAVAVTDHDTTEGIAEAVTEGNIRGIEVIPGVEVSVNFSPEMHILGYFLNGNYAGIKPVLDELRIKRQERNPKIITKLNEMGFNITLREAQSLAGGKVVGRPHIARAMVQHGYVESVGEAFEKYLSAGRPAYFKKDKLTPEEGIRAILSAGGIPVLAHPILLGMEVNRLDSLFEELAGYGLKGAEAIYVENSEEETKILIEMCRKHRLVATGGSDFHGSFKEGINLGTGRGNLRIPYEIVEQLRNIKVEE